MSYKLYHKLNLPLQPLVDNFTFPPAQFGYIIKQPDILSNQLIAALARHDFLVDFTVLFCRKPQYPNVQRMNQGIIHSDVTFVEGKWEPIYCGINYELTNLDSKLSWWETTEEPIMPAIPAVVTLDDTLRGVHYAKRNNMDPINDSYKCLDSVVINGPTLVNTSVPHSVDYMGQSETRWGLSIRLKNKFTSWENSVDRFKELISE
jgi:hypothetical protein